MKLHRYNQATDVWRGGTNSGIYHLSDDALMIIDPGLSESRGKRFASYAIESHKKITHVVATHEHSDHIGALVGIAQSFPDVEILMDTNGKHILESPDTFLAYINGGAPNKTLRGFFRPIEKNIRTLHPLNEGKFTLNTHDFEWLHFGGHSIGSGGLITPDKVLFLGDTLIPSEILTKFRLPLLYSINGQYEGFIKLEHATFDYCVTGHGRKVITKADCLSLAEENKIVLDECIGLVLERLKTPHTKEQLMAFLVDKLSLTLNYKEYLFGMSSVGSILSYLIDEDQVEVQMAENLLMYGLK